MRNILFRTGLAAALMIGAMGAQANMTTFDLNNATDGGGTPATGAITLDDSMTNLITAMITTTGPIADIRGVFFNVDDGTGLALGDISGTDITDRGTNVGSGGGLGGGTNTGPNGDFDFGLEIGTAGSGKDDFQSTTINFDTSSNGLTLASFQDFLVRLQSVGVVDAGRQGSSRLVGTPGTPGPGTPGVSVAEPRPLPILLLGLGLVFAGLWKSRSRGAWRVAV